MNKVLCNVERVCTSYQDRKILILDVWVELEGKGRFSCFNMVLDTYDKEKQRRVGTAYAAEMIIACLDFFGVDDLSQVKNHKCYLLTDKDDIWSCTDVLGLEQLPFDEYSRNRKTIIKKNILDEFVGEK
ncbi:MAG: hypothetical protein RSB94_07265 [Erysipelotrichaceae bacterium]